MYEEFLGANYHNVVRTWLKVPKVILTDEMIDSDLNMGAAQMMMGTDLLKPFLSGEIPMNEQTDRHAQKAFLHFLCAAICPALESRTHNRRFRDESKRHIKEARLHVLAIH